MKILQVIHDFLPGHNAGSEIYTYNLSRELSKRHDVVIFCTECVPERSQYDLYEREFEGLHIYEAVHNQAFKSFEETYVDPEMERLFKGILKKEKPDVIHVQHLQYHSMGYIREAHRNGIPVLFTLHEYCLQCPRKGLMLREDLSLCPSIEVDRCASCLASDSMNPVIRSEKRFRFDEWVKAHIPGRLRRMVTKRLVKYGITKPPVEPKQEPSRDYAAEIQTRRDRILEACAEVDLFIAPSKFLRQQFIDFGIDPDRIRFSDYGFVDEGYRDHPRVPSDNVRFGFVGTLVEFKGAHLILEAFRDLPETGVELDIYGDLKTFPPYTERLEELADRPGCRLQGRFENHRVAEILASIDVLIVPSLWFENSPLTIHEAFLAGIPVITSRLGGMADLVQHEKNGLLFERGDAKSLAEQMRRLTEDRALLEKLTAGVTEVKAIEDDARDHEKIYAELIAARNGKAGVGSGR